MWYGGSRDVPFQLHAFLLFNFIPKTKQKKMCHCPNTWLCSSVYLYFHFLLIECLCVCQSVYSCFRKKCGLFERGYKYIYKNVFCLLKGPRVGKTNEKPALISAGRPQETVKQDFDSVKGKLLYICLKAQKFACKIKLCARLKGTCPPCAHRPQPTQEEGVQEVDTSPLSIQPCAGNTFPRPLEAPGGHHLSE